MAWWWKDEMGERDKQGSHKRVMFRADERTVWKSGEDLSFTHGTVLYVSHARMALVSQKYMTSPREHGVDVDMRLQDSSCVHPHILRESTPRLAR